MASQLSNNIVEAISQGNVLSVAESFREAITQTCMEKLLVLREDAARKLFRENVEPDLDSAIDFTLNRLNEKGPDNLAETIKIASQSYNVEESQIIDFLKEAFDPQEPYESLAEELILGLCENSEQGTHSLVEFPNNTSRLVTLEESQSILTLWESLNNDNRKLMEQTISEGVDSFEKVLAFAEEYVTLKEGQNA